MRDFLDHIFHLMIGFLMVYWLFQVYMIIAFLVGINKGDFYISIFPNNVAIFVLSSLVLLFLKIRKII